jgi:6-pyruvoyltetrahydropterin/6-carboxytetrahydropterin synthase
VLLVEVTVLREYRFEAAHHLGWHPGACARIHGHSYRLEVAVTGPLDERGVVMDFAEVDAVIAQAVLAVYDHRDLNDVLANPTCELIALDAMGRLADAGLQVSWLRLWETERGSALVTAQR